MSVARPLLRALLRAESAWRRAAQEKQRSASAAAASAASATSSSFESDQGASSTETPDNTLLRFREPMDTSAWQRGRHGWALGGESYHLQAARASLGGNAGGSLPLGPPSSGTFRGAQLRRLILSNFRAAEAASRQGYSDLSAAEDAGFAALRALGEQRAMERCSSDSVCANGVRVEATAALVAALPCSTSRAFVAGAGGSMRSVTSAGPGVIVITNVQEEGNSNEDEEVGDDDDEDSDDGDSRALSSSSSSSPSLSPAPSSPSTAPEMRYVFTYRLRITNTNPPLLDEDDEDGSESGDDDDENDDEAAEREEEKAGAAASAATEPETGAGTTTTPGLRVQLLTRGWQIRDSSGRLHAAVPKGSPGVVGCTPVLSPGETFEYYSSTDLPTPAGVMSGSFGMTVVGVGSGSSGSGGGGSSSSGGGGESGRSKRRRKRKASSPPPPAPLLSTVASRRFDAVVAPFALRADPLKR